MIHLDPSTLNSFTIETHELHECGWVEALDLLVTNCPLMKKVVVNGPLNDHHILENCKHVLTSFPQKQIKHLVIENSNLGDEEWPEIKTAIKSNAMIETLEIIGTEMTDRFFGAVADLFEACPFITN
jgi:hypothetical protein